MVNAISVDVEEYFHAQNLQQFLPKERWESLPSRVEASTREILEIFDSESTKGTFFILGYVAKKHPGLVREIAAAGHEIASHGFWHQLVYSQSQSEFREDITSAKKIIEDISGHEVLGYRAPNFSITDKTPWAYDELVDAGYRYDSSLYPVWHPRYANLERPIGPQKIECSNGSLLVLPLAVAIIKTPWKTYRAPVAGGAYWRLLPRIYNIWGLRQAERATDRAAICYLHPWELDPSQPRIVPLPFPTNIRHYGGAARFPKVLRSYLRSFNFTTLSEVAQSAFGPECLRKSMLKDEQ